MNQVASDISSSSKTVVRLDSKEWKWLVTIAMGPAVVVVGAVFTMFVGHKHQVDVMQVKQHQIISNQDDLTEKLTENQEKLTENQTAMAVVATKMEALQIGQSKMESSLEEVRKGIRP